MRTEALGDPVGLIEVETRDLPRPRATVGQSAGDMEVHMGDGLVRGHPVVLPNGDAPGS
ncbi:hypothetical protein GCM10022224_093710 [Nonomuraea antimicrobica]|uniref:Uncharacterized protein n=1 Tax=Nonomuraea antimicrobica TaxID=561173 RepID=A0ABP7E806_9ACTN